MSTTLSLAPPYSLESALAKVRAAEDAWNSQDPARVARAYSIDSEWRNRNKFVRGRDQSAVVTTDQAVAAIQAAFGKRAGR